MSFVYPNQVCIDIIRALATQELDTSLTGALHGAPREQHGFHDTLWTLIRREAVVGFASCLSLCGFAWVRVWAFDGSEVRVVLDESNIQVVFQKAKRNV